MLYEVLEVDKGVSLNNIGIFLVDGPATVERKLVDVYMAEVTKKYGVNMYAIGVGNRIREQDIRVNS